jgi:hypothetical protein
MGFIKKNPALAAGIGLPLVVVLIFAIATIVPTWFVPAPRYDALFAVSVPTYASHDPGVGEVKYAVAQGHLKAYRRKPPAQGYELSDTQLFLFDAKTRGVREIFVPPSSLNDLTADWQEFPVPDVQSFVLDGSTTAPDGYEFRDRYTDGGGNFWPFFDGGPVQRVASVGKSGREVKIAVPNANGAYSAGNLHFLGWVTSGAPQ